MIAGPLLSAAVSGELELRGLPPHPGAGVVFDDTPATHVALGSLGFGVTSDVGDEYRLGLGTQILAKQTFDFGVGGVR